MEVFDTGKTYEVDATDIKYKCKVLSKHDYDKYDFNETLAKEYRAIFFNRCVVEFDTHDKIIFTPEIRKTKANGKINNKKPVLEIYSKRKNSTLLSLNFVACDIAENQPSVNKSMRNSYHTTKEEQNDKTNDNRSRRGRGRPKTSSMSDEDNDKNVENKQITSDKNIDDKRDIVYKNESIKQNTDNGIN